MTRSIRAHFDGKAIVPDEPVDLPINQPLRVHVENGEIVKNTATNSKAVEDRLSRLLKAAGTISGPSLTNEQLRREALYDDDLP